MIPLERLKPKPVPLPMSLVVKKGCIIFSATSVGIPGPLSCTSMDNLFLCAVCFALEERNLCVFCF